MGDHPEKGEDSGRVKRGHKAGWSETGRAGAGGAIGEQKVESARGHRGAAGGASGRAAGRQTAAGHAADGRWQREQEHGG